MSEQVINKPTPINEEVVWDKTKTIISTTDRFGNITDVNQTFIDVCGYSASELLGKPHNIIRHPDMPKIVFKVTWDNILAGRNFHAIIKNLAKSGRYYWVITDFEVGRNIMGEVVTIMARRRAVPEHVITEYVMDILDDSKREIRFEPVNTHTDTESTLGDYEISDDIFSEDHKEENILQRKSFFAKLFSTN